MALFGLLNISSQSLTQIQKGIDVTNRNISNLNTEGYNRADPKFADLPKAGTYLSSAKRIFDQYVFSRFIDSSQKKSYNEVLQDNLEAIESLFNDIHGSGLGDALDNYYNSLNDIISNPDDFVARNAFLNQAKQLIGRARSINDSLENVLQNNKKSIQESTTRINDILNKMTIINKNIQSTQNSDIDRNQYLDERDRSIKELSELIDIKVRYNKDDTVDIFTQKGHMLLLYDRYQKVSTEEKTQTMTNSFMVKPSTTIKDPTAAMTGSGTLTINYTKNGQGTSFSIDYTGKSLLDIASTINASSDLKATIINVGSDTADYRLIVATKYTHYQEATITSIQDSDSDDTQGFNIASSKEIYNKKVSTTHVYAGKTDVTEILQSGKIGALLQGSKIASETLYKLNSFVQDFAYENNSIHRQGYNLEGNRGLSLYQNEKGDALYAIDASNITLNFEDPNKIASSLTNDNSSDNSIAKALQNTKEGNNYFINTTGALQSYTQPAFLDGKKFQEFYRDEIVSPIAFESQYNKDRLDDNSFLYNALQDKLNEIGSVNLDEELINLNKLQRSYQANARVINVLDELMQTVLGLVK